MTIFYLDAEMPAEAVLFFVSVAKALDGAVPVALLEEDPVDLVERDSRISKLRATTEESASAARVIVWHDCETPFGLPAVETWRLSFSGDVAVEFRLDTPRGRERFPLRISPDLVAEADRIESEVPRLLVPVGAPNVRRERMLLRTVEELRQRGWRHVLVAMGAAQPELLRALAPDELHEEPTAGELAALLMSSSAVLDLSDESVPPTMVGRLARCVATRVVLHASSPLARPLSSELRVAQEWSPDAFCELLLALPGTVEPDLPWGMEFEAIAEDFGRILTLG